MPLTATLPTTVAELLASFTECHRRLEVRLGLLREVIDNLDSPTLRSQVGALAVLSYVREHLATEGIMHTADEEESLYPLLAETRDPEVLEALKDLEQEHLKLEPMLVAFDRLAGSVISAERATADDRLALRLLCRSLEAAYTGHVRHEERVLFPKARKVLSPAQLTQILSEMRDRRVRG